MSNTANSLLEDFHVEAHHSLSEALDSHMARCQIERLKNYAKMKLNVSDDEMGELFEQHFGSCAIVDEELENAFPEQFSGR